MTGPTLLVTGDSRGWRRQLGALAWAALEHLALAAQPDELGWVAAVGVRDVAAGLGVTKDTAARAVATLARADLVTLTRVGTHEGRRRSGYRLHMPAGIEARSCPGDADTPSQREGTSRRPMNQDRHICPTDRDSASDGIEATARRERAGAGRVRAQPDPHRPATAAPLSQPALFDPSDVALIEGAP
jgi:hypothetical protein